MTEMRCELLTVEGAKNVRDIGGYPTPDGKILTKRAFIRAASLSNLTAQGLRELAGLGVDCVIDLRSQRERNMAPDRLPEDGSVAYYHLPMLDHIHSDLVAGKFEFPGSMSKMYSELLDGDGETFRKSFTIFADPKYKTILFHCTAGKDRTGLTAMLLHKLCGLDDDSTVEDYSHSDKIARLPIDPAIPMPEHVLLSDPEYMWNTLAHIRKTYGSVERYLDKIGVTKEQQRAIIYKLAP